MGEKGRRFCSELCRIVYARSHQQLRDLVHRIHETIRKAHLGSPDAAFNAIGELAAGALRELLDAFEDPEEP